VKLRVMWFGRPAQSPYEGEVASYRRRVARRWPAEDVALKPTRGGRDSDAARARAHEAELLRRQLPDGWRLVALDEGGRAVDSVGFARLLDGLERQGTQGVAFAVGSDLGLDPELVAAADDRVSLSPMTLAHLLARLLLWEQLFRATHILGGGAYHRPSAPHRG